MDPITLAILLIVYAGAAIAKGIVTSVQHGKVEDAIDVVYGVQEDRLQDAYDTQLQQIRDQATTVRGQQGQALALMGQTGGQDTAAAGIIEGTNIREQRDVDLLDENLENALADLKAETDLAKTRNDAEYALQMTNVVTSAITQITKIGLGYFEEDLASMAQRNNYNTVLGNPIMLDTAYDLLTPAV